MEKNQTVIDTPCPFCGREEDGKWFSPCPADDCPSNTNEEPETEPAPKPEQSAEEVLAIVTARVKEVCHKSKYGNLCQRIQTEAGLDYVVNRCVKMMAHDNIHIGMALATLEAEEEGID